MAIRTRSVAERLFDPEEGCSFDPFQVVRLLELLANEQPVQATQSSWRPIEAAMRFRGHVSLAFPPSLVAGVLPANTAPPENLDQLRPSAYRIRQRYKRAAVPTVVCPFFGLFGPHGALPTIYTQYLCQLDSGQLIRDSDSPAGFGAKGSLPRGNSTRTAFRDWLDLFNNRWTALLFRAWQKYRLPVGYLRSTWRRGTTFDPPPDRITEVLFAVIGLGTPAHRNRLRVLPPITDPDAAVDEAPLARIDDRALLRFAGAFARQRPGCYELQAILNEYFGVSIQVISYTGQWLSLPIAEQTCLLDDGRTGQLGRNAVAGERIWDPGSKFRVRIGPLNYRSARSEDASDSFIAFLPDPSPMSRRKGAYLLSQLVQRYVGTELDFEIQLTLGREEVPECVMADVPEGNLGLRLGWNTWMMDEIATSLPPVVEDVRFDAVCEVVLPAAR
jgi:type VI secretion system protein ImpH